MKIKKIMKWQPTHGHTGPGILFTCSWWLLVMRRNLRPLQQACQCGTCNGARIRKDFSTFLTCNVMYKGLEWLAMHKTVSTLYVHTRAHHRRTILWTCGQRHAHTHV